jgi:hypothetical protein
MGINNFNNSMIRTLIHIVCWFLFFQSTNAQFKILTDDAQKTEQNTFEFKFPNPTKKDRYKIAVLTPMYLDSVDWEKNIARLPKFMQPGLDFYQGVIIATDTLKQKGLKFDLYVFDSKSNYMNVKNLIESDKLSSMDLIIGNASVYDLKSLADFAKKNLITFVSAVSPSDAGQEFNPYFNIVQPRLTTHIEKMHRDINKKYPENNVIFIYRNTPSEKNALSYFKNDIINPLPSRFHEIELKSDEINIEAIKAI